MRADSGRREQKPWAHLYKTARWQAIRTDQLRHQPLCERHLAKARLVPASVVHHVERHQGDRMKFFSGPFQSLCERCHNADAQSEERIGYSREVGVDGWPSDPRHPANAPVR